MSPRKERKESVLPNLDPEQEALEQGADELFPDGDKNDVDEDDEDEPAASDNDDDLDDDAGDSDESSGEETKNNDGNVGPDAQKSVGLFGVSEEVVLKGSNNIFVRSLAGIPDGSHMTPAQIKIARTLEMKLSRIGEQLQLHYNLSPRETASTKLIEKILEYALKDISYKGETSRILKSLL